MNSFLSVAGVHLEEDWGGGRGRLRRLRNFCSLQNLAVAKTKTCWEKFASSPTRLWPNSVQHQVQVLACIDFKWPWCCSFVHNICGNDFSTCVQVLLFSSHFSNSFMWDCLDVALNIYFVLSALLTSNEVAFILINVVKSPFGHKIMFRVNQISEPGVAHMLITSILDKLSWARMPGDLSSNGQILLSLRRQIFQPN